MNESLEEKMNESLELCRWKADVIIDVGNVHENFTDCSFLRELGSEVLKNDKIK